MLKAPSLETVSSVHFIGVGGIGMSSIAQYLVDLGIKVTGSDRALENPENTRIFEPLKKRGIELFSQDGSYVESRTPDILVFSSAIEDDNPDLISGKGIPLIHRSEMLALCIQSETDKMAIAVGGSCGKTSVTAWLTETLANAGVDPLMIGGGISNSFKSEDLVGNYRPGKGNFLVFEADESDKSLLNYNPDYALILNIGTDHYEKDELIDMFREFAGKVKRGVVLSRDVYDMIGKESLEGLDIRLFDGTGEETSTPDQNCLIMEKYVSGTGYFKSNQIDAGEFTIQLPLPGHHSALNAAAVLSMTDLLELKNDSTIENIETFKGVWRRSDFAGLNSKGAKIYDDYAHNVEKIISSIKTAHEDCRRVIAIFQPHGFGPLEFMRDSLFEELEKKLSDEDIFCMLPVYYAGGSSSFSPTSEEVVQSYLSSGIKEYLYFDCRKKLKSMVDELSTEDDIILIMGARDNSLSDFATELTC